MIDGVMFLYLIKISVCLVESEGLLEFHITNSYLLFVYFSFLLTSFVLWCFRVMTVSFHKFGDLFFPGTGDVKVGVLSTFYLNLFVPLFEFLNPSCTFRQNLLQVYFDLCSSDIC